MWLWCNHKPRNIIELEKRHNVVRSRDDLMNDTIRCWWLMVVPRPSVRSKEPCFKDDDERSSCMGGASIAETEMWS